MLPVNFIPLFEVMHRGTCTITIFEDHVVKRIGFKRKELKTIYESITQEPIPHCVEVDIGRSKFHSSNEPWKIILYPIGSSVIVDDEKALIRVLRDVAHALSHLHARNIVHGDVRWPNILQKSNGSFMLIDLENAGFEGHVIPSQLVFRATLDTIEGEPAIYRKSSDMYQFHRIMEEKRKLIAQEELKGLFASLGKGKDVRATSSEAFKILSDLCGLL